MMTRKDYIKIANILKEYNNNEDIVRIVRDFSSMLKADNQNFQVERFYSAVMGE